MKPSQIFQILDLAFTARKLGERFNPLFVGPPGVGKSQIVQKWAEVKGLPFIDLRAAYLEAPDLIGFPQIKIHQNREVTSHATPEFWPTEGAGVLLLEEPNRGTTSVLNTFMQLLTDRKVHKYSLPNDWIIVGCINPEGEQYDVNTMDAALKNRFAIFEVEYNKDDFVNYMKSKQWHKDIIMFVESNTWTFKKPEDIGKTEGNKYISPRSFSDLNAFLKSIEISPERAKELGVEVPQVSTDMEKLNYETILGSSFGKSFYTFRHNEAPVTFNELVERTHSALSRLKAFSDPNNCKNGHLSITVRDIIETNKIEDELLSQVLLVLPVEQGAALLRDLEFVRKETDPDLFHRMLQKYPEIKKLYKDVLKVQKNAKEKK